MRVSVVTPCYNSAAHVAESIDSALSQRLRPHEIICVDDASTDETWEVLTGIASGSSGLVRIVRHERNRGAAAARNRAIDEATGDWIAFLDHDDLWAPDKLEKQSAVLSEHPECELLHGDAWVEIDEPDPKRYRMHERRLIPESDPFATLFHRNFIVLMTAMVRRSTLAQVGGLDEELRLAIDYDLWLRLARGGRPFGYAPDPLGVRRLQPASVSKSVINMTRGELKVLERLLERDPGALETLGRPEVRWRLLSLRLLLAYRLMLNERGEEASAELRRVWSEGVREPELWRLRARLAVTPGPSAARLVKRAWRRFRDRSRIAIGEGPGADGDDDFGSQ